MKSPDQTVRDIRNLLARGYDDFGRLTKEDVQTLIWSVDSAEKAASDLSAGCARQQGEKEKLQKRIDQLESRLIEVGEVKDDCNGFPWKRLGYTHETALAELPMGTKVYALTDQMTPEEYHAFDDHI